MAIAAPAASADAPVPTADPPPRETVLLFVASWCAPCHAELARLDALSVAARPYAVRVVGYDDTPATRQMLARVAPAQRWQPEPSARGTAIAALFAGSAGLPFSAAVDAQGRRCATHRGGLTATAVREMAARCQSATTPRGVSRD